jgi:TPP-dependent pyruvate/acetoin dehydrogenase alpha subunit
VARARAGEGPAFLEFSTYRFEGHHTYEYSTRLHYREPAEVERWRERDPLELQGGRIPADRRQSIDAQIEAVIDAASRFALDSPRPDPDGGLDYLYSTGLPLRPGMVTT